MFYTYLFNVFVLYMSFLAYLQYIFSFRNTIKMMDLLSIVTDNIGPWKNLIIDYIQSKFVRIHHNELHTVSVSSALDSHCNDVSFGIFEVNFGQSNTKNTPL